MVFREKLPQGIVVTFNDVILLPGYTEVDPVEVDVRTRVSRNVWINVPIVSSPMDTVTEHELAIQLARLGGIGIVHRNLSTDEEVEMVRKVKEAPPYPVYTFCLDASQPARDALSAMRELAVDAIPVVEAGRPVGIVKKLDVLRNPDEPACKLSRRPVIATVDENPERLRRLMLENDVDIVVLVDSQGRYMGFVTVWALEYQRPFLPCLDSEGRLRVGAAISPFDKERALKLDKYADVLVLDVANAAHEKILTALKSIEKEITADLVVGNLGTYDSTIRVLTKLEKIDGVRVGIASGSICSTGVVTGVAAPTLWAVAQVADALHDQGIEIPVIADGGIKTPGDAVKAFAVGAWCVMLGRVLAQAHESPSPIIAVGEKKYKYYRGMASPGARQRRYAIDRYSRKVKDIYEGVEGLVPYAGPLENIVKEFVSGIQAAMGYIGARNIPECWEKAKLALVTVLGRKEIEPHSIRLEL